MSSVIFNTSPEGLEPIMRLSDVLFRPCTVLKWRVRQDHSVQLSDCQALQGTNQYGTALKTSYHVPVLLHTEGILK